VYIDDRGRCAECAEKRATEDLADVAVSPEAIRVATTAAAESVRNQSARIAHDVLTAMGHPALARTVESAILNAGKVQVYG
jgi:guanyl-specific ribonuclease Sa